MSKLEPITITTEARNALLRASVATGKGQADLASEAILDATTGETKGNVALPTLDEAAAVLLQHVNPAQGELITQLCKESHRSPAQYLLGYADLAHGRGETAYYLAEVQFAASHGYGTTPAGSTAMCEQCGRPFTPARPGQKFCPDTDDPKVLSCGRQAAIALIKKKRPAVASAERLAAMRGTALPADVGS